jgi:glyoxylase-like metal-dependent hydrolase (beta-lactamase superfamily II)
MSADGQMDLSSEVAELLAENRIKPVAVIATHGHLDHIFSIQAVADGYGIPSYIHSADRELFTHPERAISPAFAATLEGIHFIEPSDVRELRSGQVLDLLGMNITAIHAPGHTKGSMIFTVNDELLISGDVLFAGSIGRTDLPGGSSAEMEQTLQKKILPLSDHLRVLPGHGPETTMAQERKSNPYLQKRGYQR